MVQVSHTERIKFPCEITVEFYYDCTVDHENEDFPVMARCTGDQVYYKGRPVCKWENVPGLWKIVKQYNHWDGFDARVIESANNNQLKKAA